MDCVSGHRLGDGGGRDRSRARAEKTEQTALETVLSGLLWTQIGPQYSTHRFIANARY